MADEMKLAKAKEIYGVICRALDERNWKYERKDDQLIVTFGVSGDDIPMNFIVVSDIERQLIRVISPLPFKFSEEKRMEGAIATCVASYGMADGNFDFDIGDGSIVFRMTASFRDSRIGTGLIAYLIDCSCAMIDKYNDKFLMIDKGMLSIADFISND